GRTTGQILQRSGHRVIVQDSPGLQFGVTIAVISGGASAPALISACNGSEVLEVSPGETLTFTCPDTHGPFFTEHSLVVGHEADLSGDVFTGQFSLGGNVHVSGNIRSIAS